MGSSTSLARIGSFASPYIIHLVSSETKNAKEDIFSYCLKWYLSWVSNDFCGLNTVLKQRMNK